MSDFRERLQLDGQKIDADLQGRIIKGGAKLTRTMDSASSLSLTCDDADLKLLTSGLLVRPTSRPSARQKKLPEAAWDRFGSARMELDGARFRLARVEGAYSSGQHQMTVIFEDEIASLLRRHQRPIAVSRAERTRAEFIARLARAVKETPVVFRSPELHEDQPIKDRTEKAKQKARRKGINASKRLTVKGVQIDDAQRQQVETALEQADTDSASDRATIAMLCAGIGESAFRPVANSAGSGYAGVFQANPANIPQKDTAQQAHYFLVGGKGFQQGGAKHLATQYPDMTPGEIATRVEASGEQPGFYDRWAVEAQALLDAWGGAGLVKVTRGQYDFRVKKGQNYWVQAGTLAQEVRWRLWADANELWYASDEWLITRRPTFVIQPDSTAVRSFSFEADVGVPVSEVTFNAGVARWIGPPGSVVELDDFGPLTGRWLMWSNEIDLYTEESVLTLRRPEPKLPEPAASTSTALVDNSAPESGTVRAAILQVAKKALGERIRYVYGHQRPMPPTLFPIDPLTAAGQSDRPGGWILKGSEKVEIDCSAFVTLVYKLAGAPDPNGSGYDGSGFTGTLWANGTRTNQPRPGDLAFYGDPNSTASHVNLYIGNGMSINMGPSAGLSQLATKSVRSDFLGYRTYGVDG
jgi:cell wall-associated NlpC family hydrolase